MPWSSTSGQTRYGDKDRVSTGSGAESFLEPSGGWVVSRECSLERAARRSLASIGTGSIEPTARRRVT